MRGSRALVVLAALGAGALLLLALAGALLGGRGRSAEAPDSPPAEEPALEQDEPTPRTRTTSLRPTRISPVLGPVVTMRASSGANEGSVADGDAVDRLRPDTVLRMTVTGFDAFAVGRASQCVLAPSRHCGNPIAVQFREDGSSTFQYLATTEFTSAAAAGGCRADAAPCSIVVEDLDGDARAELVTVFHDELPPPGEVRVDPNSGLVPGQGVTVRASGLRPGVAVHVALCAIDGPGEQRCEEIRDGGSMSVRADGTAETTLRIGDERATPARCNRSASCVVTVTSGDSLVRARSARITFAAPPGPAYDPVRLAAGLAIAVGLLLAVAWTVRRTDWSPVGEEAAPEIDDADYADLDAIIAALPPEDDPVEDLLSRR